MDQQTRSLYARFRQHSPFMLVGENAQLALSSAKTLQTFRELEDQGLVRIKAGPEEENYFDVFGNHGPFERNGHEISEDQWIKETVEILDRDGIWWVVTEYFSPESEEWEHADSIGMCSGYNDPTSPFENCYVIGMMADAIEKLANETDEESN